MNTFENVYERQVDMVFKICVLHLKNIDDAQEATQDTFVNYIRYSPGFENSEHEKAWFIKVASNICKNMLRSSWLKKTTCVDDLSSICKESSIEENDKSEVLEEILKLPYKYKMALYLFYYEGYDTDEISNILNLKSSTVRSHLHRGRNLLKNVLRSDDSEK